MPMQALISSSLQDQERLIQMLAVTPCRM